MLELLPVRQKRETDFIEECKVTHEVKVRSHIGSNLTSVTVDLRRGASK